MAERYAEAGNRGARIRSDLWIGMTLAETGGITILLKSRVEPMYGASIRTLIEDMLSFFEISHGTVEIEDAGAVPFVIMARMEAVIRKLDCHNGKQFLPDWIFPVQPSTRDRFRRSRLYLPGDQPKLALNASIHVPDGMILDLEDSVAPASKDAARILVRNALRCVDFKDSERMVRINQLPLGLDDLREILPQKVDLILIPKVETPEQITEVDRGVDAILSGLDENRDVFYMPIIESALGVINAYAIAKASKRTVALAIGLEDYTADLGVERTREGHESFYARSALVNAARAAGIQAIDTVYSDVADLEGLRKSVLEAKSLGFDGKGCIHPRQIRVINKAFAPTDSQIEKAKKIVIAFEDAESRGLGVVSLGSKMIDPPVVKRALRTIDQAVKSELIPSDWRIVK